MFVVQMYNIYITRTNFQTKKFRQKAVKGDFLGQF